MRFASFCFVFGVQTRKPRSPEHGRSGYGRVPAQDDTLARLTGEDVPHAVAGVVAAAGESGALPLARNPRTTGGSIVVRRLQPVSRP